jgi:hypothetical protein
VIISERKEGEEERLARLVLYVLTFCARWLKPREGLLERRITFIEVRADGREECPKMREREGEGLTPLRLSKLESSMRARRPQRGEALSEGGRFRSAQVTHTRSAWGQEGEVRALPAPPIFSRKYSLVSVLS